MAARTVRPRQICRVGAFRSGLGAKPLSADLRTRDQHLQELCCASEMCAWSQGHQPAIDGASPALASLCQGLEMPQ